MWESDASDDRSEEVRGVRRLPEPTRERPNGMRRGDCESHRCDLIRWLPHGGENPDEGVGSSKSFVRDTVREAVPPGRRYIYQSSDEIICDDGALSL